MQKIIFTYGIIAGSIIIGSIVISLGLETFDSKDMSALEWLGYLFMILALSMIFVGIKRYRDQELGGVIKFGTAMLLGLGITGVASVIYVVVWEVNLALTDYAFIHEYTDSIISARKDAGASAEELETVQAEMDTMIANYGNPLYRLPMTFMEIFPVGLLISLISAGVLRNEKVLPASG